VPSLGYGTVLDDDIVVDDDFHDYVNFSLWYTIIDHVVRFYSLCLVHILGQLLVQFAALLSCHYCNSVLAICLCKQMKLMLLMT